MPPLKRLAKRRNKPRAHGAAGTPAIKWASIAAALVFGAAFLGPAGQTALAQRPPLSVAEFLAAGYEIESKTVERKSLPGVRPYEDLRRTLEVTTYRLVRNGEQITCIMTYDSQQEAIAEVCG